MSDAMCWECGEASPFGEPCPGCGEPVTLLVIDPTSGKQCAQADILRAHYENLT